MTDTVPPGTRPRHYRQPSRVARIAATELGMKASSVEQLYRGPYQIHHRLAAIVAAAISLNDLELVSKLMAPPEAALHELKRHDEPLSELIRGTQEYDLSEDLCEARFQACPTKRNRLAWLSSLHVQRAATLRLIHTLSSLEEDSAEALEKTPSH